MIKKVENISTRFKLLHIRLITSLYISKIAHSKILHQILVKSQQVETRRQFQDYLQMFDLDLYSITNWWIFLKSNLTFWQQGNDHKTFKCQNLTWENEGHARKRERHEFSAFSQLFHPVSAKILINHSGYFLVLKLLWKQKRTSIYNCKTLKCNKC